MDIPTSKKRRKMHSVISITEHLTLRKDRVMLLKTGLIFHHLNLLGKYFIKLQIYEIYSNVTPSLSLPCKTLTLSHIFSIQFVETCPDH